MICSPFIPPVPVDHFFVISNKNMIMILQAHSPNDTMINPVEVYGYPWKIDIGPKLLLLYVPTDLAARRMYKTGSSKPIMLSCMGIGVPGFPNIKDDKTINKAVRKGKAQMFSPSDVMPSS